MQSGMVLKFSKLGVMTLAVCVTGRCSTVRAEDWREVNENVRDQIAMLHPEIGAHNIEIDNRGRGKIELQGYVESEDARRQVQEAARRAAGVTSVDNRLKVASGGEEPRDNDVVAMKEAFRREIPHGRYNVAVNTHTDKVVLRGTADSVDTRRRLIEVASSVSKRRVVDELSVEPIKGDAEIEDAIKRTLAKEYPKLCKELEVSVKDGIALVNGSVSSHVDVDKALALVLNTEGVRDLESRVTVKGRDYTERHERK